jgi:glutamine amidotransferase-like uncharacterized protein
MKKWVGGRGFRCITGNLFILMVACLCLTLGSETSFALNGADVAIYNDAIAPADPVTGASRSGAWQDGITAITRMLTWMGLSYEQITYEDLNDSTLDLSTLYKVLLFPGGWAYWYSYWISLSGKERIHSFVQNGGGYFGICAGSFFAARKNVWEGVFYGDNAFINAYGELTGVGLDLFPGTAVGPINGIAPWPTYEMTTIDFPNQTEILADYKKAPFSEVILYYGGPYFTPDPGVEVEVLGNYRYNDQPALIALGHGSGRIVLTGPHPEIEEDSDRDGVTIEGEDEMDDKGSDWELARHLFNWLMSGGHPSCPELYAWNGEAYQLQGFLYTKTHCPESESYQVQLIDPVAPRDGELSFLIKEIDREVSFINSMALFYRYAGDPEAIWFPLPMLRAEHSSGGDVMQALIEKDDSRVYMTPGDEISVQWALPIEGDLSGIDIASVASGYYLWSHETWCEVLAIGRAFYAGPGDTVTLSACVNNMSTQTLPDNAVVSFNLVDGFNTPVGTVSAASLAPGSPHGYYLDWTVPDHAAPGIYRYEVSVWIGDTDVTWKGSALP